jgi:hypothetical protein
LAGEVGDRGFVGAVGLAQRAAGRRAGVGDSGVMRFPDFQSGMGASFDGYDSIWFLLTSGGS